MSETKCPACRGRISIDVNIGVGGEEFCYAFCADCGWSTDVGRANAYDWEVLERITPLSYFDPRPRLPTEAEEGAHRERHGDEAGWMSRRVDADAMVDVYWADRVGDVDEAWATEREQEWEAYPHVAGRPVKGPPTW